MFLSGRDEGREAWAQVLPLLHRPVRAITYDCGGIGASEARPRHEQPVPYSAIALELRDLLAALAAPGPYILVGHSFGGLIARAYLAAHPQSVAGLIMVDVSVPEAHLWPDPSPYIDGDRPDATVVDIAAAATELTTPAAGRPAVVITKTSGWWNDARVTADIDAYWQRSH